MSKLDNFEIEATKTGYDAEEAKTVRTAKSDINHPSRRLDSRSKGFGIGGGYEKPYSRSPQDKKKDRQTYGPIPHAGYYGAGTAERPFKIGQAGFKEEIDWYRNQYGRKTSGHEDSK